MRNYSKKKNRKLNTYGKKRERGGFISEAIRKKLELKKEELSKAYRSSFKDPGQLEAKEWDSIIQDIQEF